VDDQEQAEAKVALRALSSTISLAAKLREFQRFALRSGGEWALASCSSG
jgi:hypothetical protein